MIFLMCVGFAIEICNYFRARSFLTLGAYSAARAYAVKQDLGYAQRCAEAYLSNIAVPGSVLCIPSSTPTFGAPYSMTVVISYRTIVPWFTYFIIPQGTIPGGAPLLTVSPDTPQDSFFMFTTVYMVAD